MSWSSVTRASRHMGLGMRAKTPKTAFHKFRQYKRLLYESKGHSSSSGSSSTSSEQTAAQIQAQVMKVLQPVGQRVADFAKSNADIGAMIVLVPASILTSFYVWKPDTEKKVIQTEEKHIKGPNAVAMVAQKTRLVSNATVDPETMDSKAQQNVPEPCVQKSPVPEPDITPCTATAEPCLEEAETSAESLNSENPSNQTEDDVILTSNQVVDTTAVGILNLQQKAEESGLFIPVTVGQDSPRHTIATETMQNIITQDTQEYESPTEKMQRSGGRRRRQKKNLEEE